MDDAPINDVANGDVEAMRAAPDGSPPAEEQVVDDELVNAVLRGDVEAARAALDGGASTECRTLSQPHDTPLLLALKHDKLECARLLLDRQADVDAADDCGWSPLNVAADKRCLPAMRLLIEHGAAVDCRNEEGVMPLHFAAWHGSTACARLLLQSNAPVDAPCTKNGASALQLAAHEGHEACARLLLDFGASVNVQSPEGWTALHRACTKRHLECVRLLLARGASTDCTCRLYNVYSLLEQDGFAPLHLAVAYGNMDIVWALLRAGASVRLTTHNGMTTLHLAVVKGNLECADMLLTFAPDLISVANRSGSTPLHLAALHGRLDCMRLLIDNWRAEVDSVDIDKCTPLRVAAGHCHLDCMRLLLDRGAAVDGFLESERTPLVATGRTSRLVLALECILLLLQRGAAIDAGFGARVALVAVMKSKCEVLLRVLWRCGGKALKSADSAAASATAAGSDKPGVAALLAAWHAGALRTWSCEHHAMFPAAFRADIAATLLATAVPRDASGSAADNRGTPAGGDGAILSTRRGPAAASGQRNPLRALPRSVLEAIFQALLVAHMGGPPVAT